eukprot:TRINITY_DN91255_c0_g1_i1.p1 TRINITY_DN91255_c0_g1~~TRINITY_DN91255_c0_g1_i1.p1  ORF type:complete len:347 (-),score=92.84 TRINITY_DN91255_c0_g1_i1:272-1312(-)
MLVAQLPEFRATTVVDRMLAGCASKIVEHKLENKPAQKLGRAKADKAQTKGSCEVPEAPVYKPSIQLLAYAAYSQQPQAAEDKVDTSKVEEVAQYRVSLTRQLALLLQSELLAAFTAPAFQKALHELARAHNATKAKTSEYQFAFQALVRSEQINVIKKHGFRASAEGVKDMLQAFTDFENDVDVYVNSEAIKEALYSPSRPAPVLEPEKVTTGDKPGDVYEVVELLHMLHTEYSLPDFQAELQDLKECEDEPYNKKGGYYHLTGRAELAFSYQENILPLWGFEVSKEGVNDMISTCAQYLHLKEVQVLFDAINSKLGMSDEACQRFRRLAVALAQEKPSVSPCGC